jgi:hypothetical protein
MPPVFCCAVLNVAFRRAKADNLPLIRRSADVSFRVSSFGSPLQSRPARRNLSRGQTLRLRGHLLPRRRLNLLSLSLFLSDLHLLNFLRRIATADLPLVARRLNALNAPASCWPHAWRFHALFNNGRRFVGRRRTLLNSRVWRGPRHGLTRRSFVIDLAAGRRSARTCRAADAAAAAARAGTTATEGAGAPATTAMAENRPPRPAIRRGAVLIAVEGGQYSLERATAAVAVRTGELTAALVAWIAAIGRIADPLVDVDIAASFAAAHAAAQPRKNSAMAEDAATLAAVAAVARARCARVRAAIIAAAIPNNRLGDARQREAACRLSARPTGRAAAAAAKQRDG